MSALLLKVLATLRNMFSQNVFYALQTGRQDLVVTGAEDTLASHLLVFAAEKARKENRVVDIQANCTF